MGRNITVVGTGHVGLIVAIGLAELGHRVIGADTDSDKVDMLERGRPTVFEDGLADHLTRNLCAGRLSFTSDVGAAVRSSEVVYLAVGTPASADGSADLSQLDAAVETLAANVNGYKVVVIKSTVPVGTARSVAARLPHDAESGCCDVVANPEFLREGSGLQDFFQPDRIVVGYHSGRSRCVIEDVYAVPRSQHVPIVWCTWESAELAKYASNCFLATKVTFVNQLANVAEEVGADAHVVADVMGMDRRISPHFLQPGPGYGGSCFPKDVSAMIHLGEVNGTDMSLLRQVREANATQRTRMVAKLDRLLGGLAGKQVGLLGLAFKAGTDDVRESPAIDIVGALVREGASIRAHDPQAEASFATLFPDAVSYCSGELEAVADADAAVICTEWEQYRCLDLERARKVMRGNVVLDMRNMLDAETASGHGFVYEGVGRPAHALNGVR